MQKRHCDGWAGFKFTGDAIACCGTIVRQRGLGKSYRGTTIYPRGITLDLCGISINCCGLIQDRCGTSISQCGTIQGCHSITPQKPMAILHKPGLSHDARSLFHSDVKSAHLIETRFHDRSSHSTTRDLASAKLAATPPGKVKNPQRPKAIARQDSPNSLRRFSGGDLD